MKEYKYNRDNYEIDKQYLLNADYQVLKLIKRNSKILEIGCATGYFGRFLSKEMGCELTGVEIDCNSAEMAKEYYNELIVGDVEDQPVIGNIKGKYDIILCIAVIEHLKSPPETLKELRRFLKDGGYFIITLPNIAHWKIRLDLLFGKFEYREYGILDKTHLRFFTLKTAKKLIENAELKIEHFSIDPDMGMPKINGLIRRIPIIGVEILRGFYSLFPGIFGYQFIFKAKRIDE